ncbi:MAG: hypothetical protein COT17_05505 [Elusimicrobia bacterium CG08_land_8_20_14_0_20_51_18]|nr:MAG: hypothetical protein COT17_05505 [Elusimicrobia bacterium CG08_land_8_20_14_0_20_51_18]
MKKIFFFLLFPALGLWAGEKAVLWLPSSNASVDAFLDKMGDDPFKITIALSSKDGLDLKRLKKREERGDLEIANTPEGAPFVSLLYYPRSVSVNYVGKIENNPYFFALRISDSKAKFAKDFGTSSPGLVLPYGEVTKDWLQLAKAFGYKWLASSLPENSTGFALVSVDSVTVAPFQVCGSSWEITASSPVFCVVDDTLDLSSGSVDMLAELFREGGAPFSTVGEVIAVSASTETARENFTLVFNPWRKYSEYLLKDEQYGLLGILAKVRNDIMAFLNSNSKKVKDIMERYYGAEKYAGLLPYSPDETAAEEEIRTALEEIYQLMGKAAPGFIYQSFSKLSFEDEVFKIEKTSESVTYSRVEISTGSGNTRISTFTVSGTSEYLDFSLELDSSLKNGQVFEIYIDVNGRIGSGSIKLSGNKKEKIIHNNAWEYALVSENRKMQMYQSGYYSDIRLKKYPLSYSGSRFYFRVPAADLKGNYLNWNYFPLVYGKNSDKSWTLVDGAYSRMDLGYLYPVKEKK